MHKTHLVVSATAALFVSCSGTPPHIEAVGHRAHGLVGSLPVPPRDAPRAWQPESMPAESKESSRISSEEFARESEQMGEYRRISDELEKKLKESEVFTNGHEENLKRLR